jgi:hypothetical protein
MDSWLKNMETRQEETGAAVWIGQEEMNDEIKTKLEEIRVTV